MSIYAVDIDGTLCAEQRYGFWNYDKAFPISETIKKINALYDNKHTIVIYTARFTEDKKVTKKWLKLHGVKYHRLIMGKFRADFYVDSNAIIPEAL